MTRFTSVRGPTAVGNSPCAEGGPRRSPGNPWTADGREIQAHATAIIMSGRSLGSERMNEGLMWILRHQVRASVDPR